ncbi:hypothetical protein N665_0742s0014 [Sinapis alba]|nr:hypothetical protein N665_0742s0014 [Sinapis alba]
MSSLMPRICSGQTCLFWHDNWTGLGPLSDIIGELGPMVTGITSMAKVSDVCPEGQWILPRGRHPLLLMLRQCLPPLPPSLALGSADVFLWRNGLVDPPAGIWLAFFRHSAFTPPMSFDTVQSWVTSSSPNSKLKQIYHFIFHAVVYCVWKERNSRLHNGTPKLEHVLVKEIQVLLRARLSGLDSSSRLTSSLGTASQNSSQSYISIWFQFIQPG